MPSQAGVMMGQKLTRIFRLGLCCGLIMLTLALYLNGALAGPVASGRALAAVSPEAVAAPLREERLLNPNQPYLALTFDDGPSSEITPLLVQGLAQRDARATFFVLGCQAEQQREVVAEIARLGHQVGSHGYDHLHPFTEMEGGQLEQELAMTAAIIEDIIGSPPAYVRPPYGSIDQDAAAVIDVPVMLWNIDPRDWEMKSPEQLASYIVEHAFSGGVVIMHDEFANTLEGTLAAVDQLQAECWQFVTLTEYSQLAGMTPKPGLAYRGTGLSSQYQK